MNIGDKPTFNENVTTTEIHFFDTNEDLYDKQLTISVLKFVRDEKKFDSLDQLKSQIQADKNLALQYFSDSKH